MSANVKRVSALLASLIETGKSVAAYDHTTGKLHPVSAQLAASSDGFLPLFLAAGDTVWREATGRSLGIKFQDDAQAVLGQRVAAIGSPVLAPVMLSMMEAMTQAARPDVLVINDLQPLWLAAQERIQWRQSLAAPVRPPGPAREEPEPSSKPRAGFTAMRP